MIIKRNLKRTIVVYFYSVLLLACSGNSEVSSGFASPNNTYSTRGFIIEQPQQITVYVPQSESELNQQQLFSGALEAHNDVRQKHSLQPLNWSEKLAESSQQWSDHLGSGKSCRMYHRPEKAIYGENLFIASPKVWNEEGEEVYRERTKVTIRDVVKEWTDGERWYNPVTNNCQEGKQCEQYKQLISQNTTEVGCGVTFCADDSQTWVCSYNPVEKNPS